MLDEVTIQLTLNRLTFSQREAEKIVGGRNRLAKLVGAGRIRCKKNSAQNSRWACNAWDCVRHAELSNRW